MPRKRLSMRQVHEVLRLKWAVGLSERQIARRLGLSRLNHSGDADEREGWNEQRQKEWPIWLSHGMNPPVRLQ